MSICMMLPRNACLCSTGTRRLGLITRKSRQKTITKKRTFMGSTPISLLLIDSLSHLNSTGGARARLVKTISTNVISRGVSVFYSTTGLTAIPETSVSATGLGDMLGLASARLPLVGRPIKCRG